MGTDQNRRVAVELFEEVVGKARVDRLHELSTPDLVDHAAVAVGWGAGRAGMERHLEWLHGAVQDLEVSVDDLVAEGERVVVFWRLKGTHSGDLWGVPATGRSIEVNAISLLTFRDGQLCEYVVQPDRLGVLEQLGAVPG